MLTSHVEVMTWAVCVDVTGRSDDVGGVMPSLREEAELDEGDHLEGREISQDCLEHRHQSRQTIIIFLYF